MWNFKGSLWDSTQKYLTHTHLYLDVKIWELLDVRAQKCFWNDPQVEGHPIEPKLAMFSSTGLQSFCQQCILNVLLPFLWIIRPFGSCTFIHYSIEYIPWCFKIWSMFFFCFVAASVLLIYSDQSSMPKILIKVSTDVLFFSIPDKTPALLLFLLIL